MIHRTPAGALALCLLATPLAAQPLPEALQAASPETAGPPPAALTLPMPAASPTLPTDPPSALRQWQQSNRDVGTFARGHADLLRWEAQQAAPTPNTITAPVPLSLADAWGRSLRSRPDLVAIPGANTREAAAQRQALLRHSVELRRAWLTAVAARETLQLEQRQLQAADSAAELGRRMVQAGNWSQARLLREQLAQARQQAVVLQTQTEADQATEVLIQAMGVWRAAEVRSVSERLPNALPALPARPVPPDNLEGQVLEARVGAEARRGLVALSARGVTAASRIGWQQAQDAAVQALPTDALPAQALQLTDPRPQREPGLQATLVEEAELLQEAVRLRSLARSTWRELAQRYALAEQADTVLLPLQTSMEQETLLRYNGMLQSTWELLDAARARLRAATDASHARYAFWLAQLNWELLLAGGEPQALPSMAGPSTDTSASAAH